MRRVYAFQGVSDVSPRDEPLYPKSYVFSSGCKTPVSPFQMRSIPSKPCNFLYLAGGVVMGAGV